MIEDFNYSYGRDINADGDWRALYIKEFESIACADSYPCIYVKQAYQKGYLSFHFIDEPDNDHQCIDAFITLQKYTQSTLAIQNKRIAAMKIILFVIKADAIEGGHEQTAWELLRTFLDIDPCPWPKVYPDSPEDAYWAYCFAGQRFFVNISSPEHTLRKSRNLGRHLVLVMQLRDGIDYIAPANKQGNAIRKLIRKRIADYDLVPVSNHLATHGQGKNRDWKQFWLGDDDAKQKKSCPLKSMHEEK